MLKKGDKIPDFVSVADDGEKFDSSILNNTLTLFYFYPKDDTPGCTIQACSLRDTLPELQSHGVKIYGIGKGNLNSHKKFKAKYNLNFPLLLDEDLEISQKFGVAVEKSMFGKKYLGIKRTSFIVNKEGIIVAVLENVNPLTHAHEIQNIVKEIA